MPDTSDTPTPSADEEIETPRTDAEFRRTDNHNFGWTFARILERELVTLTRSHANEREELRKKIVYHDSLLDEREAKHADQIGELATELNEARATLAAREGELATQKQLIAQYALDGFADEKIITDLKAELATAQSEVKTLKYEAQLSKAINEAASAERDSLRSQLTEAQAEKERIRGQLISHERMAAKGVYVDTEKYEAMVAQLTEAQRELSRSREEISELSARLFDSGTQLKEAQKLISDNHLVIEGLGDDLKEANAKLAEAQKDIGTYQRRLERALAELEEARLGGSK